MWSEEKLDAMLTDPSDRLVGDMARIEGDILILGAGGKMGPSLAILAKRAAEAAGTPKRIIAVSRFTDPVAAQLLRNHGVETLAADLLDRAALEQLPQTENVIFMAGKKFGTHGQETDTWAMNTRVPALVADHYRHSRIVVFSTGNIYPRVPLNAGGCTEDTLPSPVGEYGMSALGRERMFEYAAQRYGTPIVLFRLNYAVDLRYGVLNDMASNILAGTPISLSNPCFNCVWQKDANEIALRCLPYANSHVFKLNVTGPETAAVAPVAHRLARLLGCSVSFAGTPGGDAYLNDAARMVGLFGYPQVPLDTLVEWQAQWLLQGGRSLGKPTHFEESEGKY
ncbi:NAD(P)-dependent oxidoreductase [Ruminococcaceae bacterium OttesenSCG-928-D13]|nr:NAD(P)-dependent oxidoreductase [Ruminococcaceae bacterium OttesenSCG-928-D13]